MYPMKTTFLLSLILVLSACSGKKADPKGATGPEKAVGKPAEEPAAKPAEEPAAKPAEKPAEKPVAASPGKIEVPENAKTVDQPFWHQRFSLEGKDYIVLNSFKHEKTKDIKGYEAPIETQVILDNAGNIVSVKILSHKETDSFIERIEKEWIGKFDNHPHDKPILGEGGIDALSEATLSADALRKAVDILRGEALGHLLKPATERQ